MTNFRSLSVDKVTYSLSRCVNYIKQVIDKIENFTSQNGLRSILLNFLDCFDVVLVIGSHSLDETIPQVKSL
jgi:hypothetical protein